MNALFANAIDSLRIACEYSTAARATAVRKHVILTLFHAIELLLKERLFREHPLLIYRNLNTLVEDDTQTVSVKEALIRLENIGVAIPEEPRGVLGKLQGRRNRIEHHRYDEEADDQKTISESIAFAIFFIEAVLEESIHEDLGPELTRDILGLVFSHEARRWAADFRLKKWMMKTWPAWDPVECDMPEDFEGTLDCPICRECHLVICPQRETFCYYCNTPVEADLCPECGITFVGDGHTCM